MSLNPIALGSKDGVSPGASESPVDALLEDFLGHRGAEHPIESGTSFIGHSGHQDRFGNLREGRASGQGIGNELAIADGTDRFALTGSRIQGHRSEVEGIGCPEDVVDRQRRCTTVVRRVASKLFVEEVLHGLLCSSGQESIVLI